MRKDLAKRWKRPWAPGDRRPSDEHGQDGQSGSRVLSVTQSLSRRGWQPFLGTWFHVSVIALEGRGPDRRWVLQGGQTPMSMKQQSYGARRAGLRFSHRLGTQRLPLTESPLWPPGWTGQFWDPTASGSSTLVWIKLHPSSVLRGHRLRLFHLKNFWSWGPVTLLSIAQAHVRGAPFL